VTVLPDLIQQNILEKRAVENEKVMPRSAKARLSDEEVCKAGRGG
jgi:hypothetical protein